VVIGSARNFEPVYDLATLLKAVPIIAEDHPNVEVHVAGDGTQKEYLEKLTAELGLKDRVKFVGFLDQKRLADFFRNIDIYVSTALSDGLSVTFLEATACGAFPVVADIAGNRFALQAGLEGRVFESQNPRDLAAKLKDLLQQPDAALQTGKKNSKIVCRSFGKHTVVDKMIEVYDELLTSV
ncbi:glycosyltransferase family 4 protein, partial [candidate division KSB1 bacterium]|nr:glycosyltransferase family 4 protein [candidate division KSB1 bacterium]NIR71252.1 glycosyltransferase family 4 protein [candidate division KSB1 bacterium]NIS26193.1 glycosyltransferase family 4 protein [candidate division KSB1 bacterium]NIT72971.1 glycosyltransferase family 4 protein [candidate division KSB1 bacterium]NIU26840.1 glycosyltransferase family 4 protein [candidate division KSB1 bacterium]